MRYLGDCVPFEGSKCKLTYWYRVTTWVCPLCGSEDRYRERVYGEKPEDYAERFPVIEGWCGNDC